MSYVLDNEEAPYSQAWENCVQKYGAPLATIITEEDLALAHELSDDAEVCVVFDI